MNGLSFFIYRKIGGKPRCTCVKNHAKPCQPFTYLRSHDCPYRPIPPKIRRPPPRPFPNRRSGGHRFHGFIVRVGPLGTFFRDAPIRFVWFDAHSDSFCSVFAGLFCHKTPRLATGLVPHRHRQPPVLPPHPGPNHVSCCTTHAARHRLFFGRGRAGGVFGRNGDSTGWAGLKEGWNGLPRYQIWLVCSDAQVPEVQLGEAILAKICLILLNERKKNPHPVARRRRIGVATKPFPIAEK